MKLKIGDKIRVLTNAKGTAWETGFIHEIKDNKAVINYGLKELPIFGLYDYWKDFNELELIEKEGGNNEN